MPARHGDACDLRRSRDHAGPTRRPLWSDRQWWLAVALCLVTSLLRLVWPGDTGWINDEPLFLNKAAAMNSGSLAAALSQRAGLHGTVGLTYGPVAVWIFALLLRLSSDLIVVAALRTLLWSALTCTALLWLGRLVPRPSAFRCAWCCFRRMPGSTRGSFGTTLADAAWRALAGRVPVVPWPARRGRLRWRSSAWRSQC